jgi:predicted RNA binding protein YcfA (HicA-like mRNA interferase family)
MKKQKIDEAFTSLRQAIPGVENYQDFTRTREQLDEWITVEEGGQKPVLAKIDDVIEKMSGKESSETREFQGIVTPWNELDPPELEEEPAPGERVPKDEWFPGSPCRKKGIVTWGFYLPFHLFRKDEWGAYVTWEGIEEYARHIDWACSKRAGFQGSIRSKGPMIRDPHTRSGLSRGTLRKIAARSILFHEHYHHKIESLLTRWEVVLKNKAYLPSNQRYRKVYLTDACLEEAAAVAYQYQRTNAFITPQNFDPNDPSKIISKWPQLYGLIKEERTAIKKAIPHHENLPGYRMGMRRPLESHETKLFEEYHLETVGSNQLASKGGVWSFFEARGLSHSYGHHVFVIGRKHPLTSRLAASGLLSIRPRKLIKLAKKWGCKEMPGRGKGSHVKMENPRGEQQLTIPRKTHPGIIKSCASDLKLSVEDFLTGPTSN